MLTRLHALTALDAGHGLGSTVFTGNNADAAQVLVKLLIKRLRTGLDALQASHTGHIFLNHQLLHCDSLLVIDIFVSLYRYFQKKQRLKPHLRIFCQPRQEFPV